MGMGRKQKRASSTRNTKVWMSTKSTHRWNQEVRPSATTRRVSHRVGPGRPSTSRIAKARELGLDAWRVEGSEGTDDQLDRSPNLTILLSPDLLGCLPWPRMVGPSAMAGDSKRRVGPRVLARWRTCRLSLKWLRRTMLIHATHANSSLIMSLADQTSSLRCSSKDAACKTPRRLVWLRPPRQPGWVFGSSVSPVQRLQGWPLGQPVSQRGGHELRPPHVHARPSQ